MRLLAPGGLLAYSTCALNPIECEAVVSAALHQQQGFETVEPHLELELELLGWISLGRYEVEVIEKVRVS